MNRSTWLLAGLAGVLTAASGLGACSATDSPSGGFGGSGSEGQGVGNGPSGTNTGGPGPGSTGTNSTTFNPVTTGPSSTGAGGTGCDSGDNEDRDGDGWTKAQGDCNDCDPNVNPGAIEVLTSPSADGGMSMPADEDCDGTPDNVPASCDSGIPVDDGNAFDAARVIGVCNVASTQSQRGPGWAWGVVDAGWVRADGSPTGLPGVQAGVMPTFGSAVLAQEGENLLAISSGHGRTPGQPGACNKDSCFNHMGAGKPPGFPSPVTLAGHDCGGGPATNINDDVALQLTLRAPTNATGYNFKFKFYSFEFSEYVCSMFNDQFIALVTPAPMGAINGNISFDSANNPVSVNIGFFDVCNPNSGEPYTGPPGTQPNPYCPSGPGDLAGTGFDGVWNAAFGGGKNWGGATSWLQSQAPIGGGEEFTIRFTMWDAGDQNLDSTTLIDGFEWIASGGTVNVGTGEVDGGGIH